MNIETIQIFISEFLKFEIFPSEVYFLDKLPSEINLHSTVMIFLFSIAVSALASYVPAMRISKMKTFRALKYE